MGAWQDSVRSVTSSFTRREGGIVGGGGRRRTRRNQSNEIRRGRRRNERSVTNAIPNIDFDFPDDEQTKLLRSRNYHQVGETLKNITKREARCRLIFRRISWIAAVVIRMRIVKIVIVQHQNPVGEFIGNWFRARIVRFLQAFGRCGKRLVRRKKMEMKKRKKIDRRR